MPVYEYLCGDCGGFTDLQPLSDYDRPQPCPQCARPAPRTVLTAPAVSRCSSRLRTAHRRNEASVERPQRGRLAGGRSAARHVHPASAGRVAGGRPWMLSH